MSQACPVRLVFGAMILGVATSTLSAAVVPNWKVVAHRGFSYVAPENTLIAMEKASQVPADAGWHRS